MKPIAIICLGLSLAGCGVERPQQKPSPVKAVTSITIDDVDTSQVATPGQPPRLHGKKICLAVGSSMCWEQVADLEVQ